MKTHRKNIRKSLLMRYLRGNSELNYFVNLGNIKSNMKQFIINVPDNKQSFFEELMHNLDFTVTNQNVLSEPFPEWHKQIVNERIASAKEEDYIPWEEAKKQIRRK